MPDLLKRFRRERPGVWTCLTTASIGALTIPSGAKFVVGWPFDDVDVAQFLEDEYAKQQHQ